MPRAIARKQANERTNAASTAHLPMLIEAQCRDLAAHGLPPSAPLAKYIQNLPSDRREVCRRAQAALCQRRDDRVDHDVKFAERVDRCSKRTRPHSACLGTRQSSYTRQLLHDEIILSP